MKNNKLLFLILKFNFSVKTSNVYQLILFLNKNPKNKCALIFGDYVFKIIKRNLYLKIRYVKFVNV